MIEICIRSEFSVRVFDAIRCNLDALQMTAILFEADTHCNDLLGVLKLLVSSGYNDGISNELFSVIA